MKEAFDEILQEIDARILQIEADANLRVEQLKTTREGLLKCFELLSSANLPFSIKIGNRIIEAIVASAKPETRNSKPERNGTRVTRPSKTHAESRLSETQNSKPKTQKGIITPPRPPKADTLTPMHPKVIAIAGQLKEPFDAIKLQNAASMGLKTASNAITRWLLKGWVKRVDYGLYARTAKFGGASGDPEIAEVNKLHQQIRGEMEALAKDEE
jgi:hypothetical protein